MDILFLTLIDIRDIEEKGIYQDLLREFVRNGHKVCIVSPFERRVNQNTKLINKANYKLLKVKIGNIQKTNLIEKGISTVLLERQYLKAIKRYLSDYKFDYIVYSTPPITFNRVIQYIKMKDNAASYLLLKDIFPQNAVDLQLFSKKSVLYWYFRKKEKKLYRISDYIGCMSQANINYLLKHNEDIQKEKVHISPNCIEISKKLDITEEQILDIRNKYDLPRNTTIFIYGGNLGKPQGISFVIDCLKRNQNREDRYFVLCGTGTETKRIEEYIKNDRPQNVKYIPGLTREEYEELLRACDVGLIFLDHRFTIPNFPSRLLSYMEMGMPVLSCTDSNSDVGKVIEESGFGWWCESKDAGDFENAIKNILISDQLKSMGQTSRESLCDKYDVKKVCKRILKIMTEFQICKKCVMDSTDKNLILDENGICPRCNEYEQRIVRWWNHGNGHEDELNKILDEVKKSGQGNKYDCILGLSGGLDSSYMLHLAVTKWGLRPFVFHVDAGWNLPVAESNVRKLCDKLGVKLHIKKMDFDEMRQMQIAFFKTGHAGLDAPQDHAFIAQVDHFSEKLGVKYILNGYNICTEIVANPASWNDGAGPTADKTYIKDVLRKHGGFRTKKYVYTTGFRHKFWLPYVKGVKTLQLLNYVPFTKQEMIDTLVSEYDYKPYKQKHFEDLLTKFLEGWWLPTRFGYDIRKAQLSSLVVTGQMTRDEALEILKEPPLTEDESNELFMQVAQKLQISEEELMSYHELPKTYKKYRNNNWAFNIGIKLYTALGLDKRIRQ